MVFLINSLPFLIVILMGLVIRYAVPSKVGKLMFGLLTVLMLVVYFQIQPSYMPKGTVKPLPALELKQKDIPIVDHGLKSKVTEINDARINEMNEINSSINKRIESNKE